MSKLGVWQVKQFSPLKVDPASVDLEKNLEDWIEKDPSLIQEGLTIVGRQVNVEGGRLDLLAVDTQGRWIVIEIKAGQVRRETVAQAIDYTSCISALPWSALLAKANAYLKDNGVDGARSLEDLKVSEDEPPRSVWMTVVGTGRALGLERMVNYLSDLYNVPITIVSYEVFRLASGEQIMVRELTEGEGTEVEPDSTTHYTLSLEQMRAKAAENGIGEAFEILLDVAIRHDFYPRTYKRSVMYTPLKNKTRMLYTVRTDADKEGNLQLYVWHEAFSEFDDVSDRAHALLGEHGWRSITVTDARQFVAKVDELMKKQDEVEEEG